MKLDNKSISALLNLFDDPDKAVYNQIKTELSHLSIEDIPMLEEQLMLKSLHSNTVIDIQKIISEIQVNHELNNFSEWLQKPNKTLLEGVFRVNKILYPDLTLESLQLLLSQIRQSIWLEISEKQTSFEIVNTINQILFDTEKFTVLREENVFPFHFCIKAMLEDREASANGMSLLYAIIAEALKLPVHPVIHPDNKIILAFLDKGHILSELKLDPKNSGVLFYLDLREKDKIVDYYWVEKQFKEKKIALKRAYLEPASSTDVIKCYIQSILLSFHRKNQINGRSFSLERLLEKIDFN